MFTIIKGVIMVFTQSENIRKILWALIILVVAVPIMFWLYNATESIGKLFGVEKPEVVAAKKIIQTERLKEVIDRKNDVATIEKTEHKTNVKVILSDMNTSSSLDDLERELLSDIALMDRGSDLVDPMPLMIKRSVPKERNIKMPPVTPEEEAPSMASQAMPPTVEVTETLPLELAPLKEPSVVTFTIDEEVYVAEGARNLNAINKIYERIEKIK